MASKKESLNQDAGHRNSEPRHDRENSLDVDEDLPTYQDSTSLAPDLHLQPTGSTASSAVGPTVSSPFNFPVTNEIQPPEYSSQSANQRAIAIPQQFPDPAAPFLTAYAPALLNYGIPASSWYSFLDTMSAFLTARVGKRAVSHAGDIAASVGRVPKRLGKDVANHAKATFKEIGYQAKNLNPIGVLGSVIGGTVSLTVGTAFRVVGSAASLPATAIGAGANIKTPRQRAEVYAAAANKDWFHKRGLHAHLLNTAELAILLNVTTQQLLDAGNLPSGGAAEKMKALQDLIEGVEFRQKGKAKANPQPQITQELSPAGYPADIKKPSEPEEQSEAGPSGTSSSRVEAPAPKEDTDALQLSAQTLWLVILRDTPVETSTKQ